MHKRIAKRETTCYNLKLFGNYVDYAKNLRSTNIEKLPSLHFEADMYPWSMLVL